MPNRTGPIPGTSSHVKGYPDTLRIYQIAASSYWQVAVFTQGKFVRRSTKTAEKASALKFAKAFYNDILLKQAQNLPLAESKTFELVATDLAKEDQGRVDRGERKQSLVDDSKYIYDADVGPFFRRHHVKDVNYQRLLDYIKYLKTSREEEKKAPLGSKTIKNHFILISKILKHAHKLGYIDKLPVFPTIQAKDNPREWLSDDQYTSLMKKTKEEIGKRAVARFVPLTDHLTLLIEFTVNSFLRPPDIKNLKHKQITVVKNYLRIMAYSKVKAAPVITMPKAAEVYKKLSGEPDDYVFFPEHKNRDYAMQVMNRQFNHVLKAAGLKEGPAGAPRTLYSLRHSCIMNSLLKAKNINLLVLARNCRTSVEMLERFYASQLTAEMNAHQILDQVEAEVISIDTSAFENLVLNTPNVEASTS